MYSIPRSPRRWQEGRALTLARIIAPATRVVHAAPEMVQSHNRPWSGWPRLLHHVVANAISADLAHPRGVLVRTKHTPITRVSHGRVAASVLCVLRRWHNSARGGCRTNISLVGFGEVEVGRSVQAKAGFAWLACRQSLRMLCVAAMSFHSLFTAGMPRRAKRLMPRLCLVWPNTGSIVALRFL